MWCNMTYFLHFYAYMQYQTKNQACLLCYSKKPLWSDAKQKCSKSIKKNEYPHDNFSARKGYSRGKIKKQPNVLFNKRDI